MVWNPTSERLAISFKCDAKGLDTDNCMPEEYDASLIAIYGTAIANLDLDTVISNLKSSK